MVIQEFSFQSKGNRWMGVDILNEDVADNMEKCVWEPGTVTSEDQRTECCIRSDVSYSLAGRNHQEPEIR